MMTYGPQTFKKLRILSSKLVILSLFSQLFKKNIERIIKNCRVEYCFDVILQHTLNTFYFGKFDLLRRFRTYLSYIQSIAFETTEAKLLGLKQQ